MLCERAVVPAERGVAFTNDRRLQRVHPMQLSEAQILAFLGAIECPTLLLRADDGIAYNPDVMAARVAAIRDLREVMVPGRHHVHMDDPEVVAPHINDLLLPTSR